jgi:hypothetical protein
MSKLKKTFLMTLGSHIIMFAIIVNRIIAKLHVNAWILVWTSVTNKNARSRYVIDTINRIRNQTQNGHFVKQSN